MRDYILAALVIFVIGLCVVIYVQGQVIVENKDDILSYRTKLWKAEDEILKLQLQDIDDAAEIRDLQARTKALEVQVKDLQEEKKK